MEEEETALNMFWLTFFAAALFIALCSFFIVNHFLSFKFHKNTFPVTLMVLSINMFLLLSITYLLPLDVYSTAQNTSWQAPPLNGTSLGERDSLAETELATVPNFDILWSSLYWTQFVICWFILPVLISYLNSKYLYSDTDAESRNIVLRRIQRALLDNFKFYIFCMLAVILGLIYLKITTSHSLKEITPLIIAISHLYSLTYTLFLLSNGLLKLPKMLLLKEHDEKKLFVKLSQNNEAMNESKLSLLEISEKLLSLRSPSNADTGLSQLIQDCQLEVQRCSNELELTIPTLNAPSRTENHITAAKLNQYYNIFVTEFYNYTYHLAKSNELIHSLVVSQKKGATAPLNAFIKLIGVFSVILSTIVVLLELIPNKFGHGIIFTGTSIGNFFIEMILLFYNTICSLYSMSTIKIQNFHLVSNGQSSPKNALYFSLYSSRLLFPLCFNYVTLIPKYEDATRESSFQRVLYRQLEVIPLAKFLNEYLPLLFVILVPIAYYFELKDKVMIRILGEEYYYQLFGSFSSTDVSLSYDGRANSRLNEDYEYSLQDGQYLFQRATSNYNLNGRYGS